MVARETGWSYHDILWNIPLSAIMQIADVYMWDKGANLRWHNQFLDIEAILNG